MQLIGQGGKKESTKLLGMLNIMWRGFKITFTIIEVYAGMYERLVRDLAI